MTITINYQDQVKRINLDTLQQYQIDNIIQYLRGQRQEIRDQILLDNPPVDHLVFLWDRVSTLNGTLDTIINYQCITR